MNENVKPLNRKLYPKRTINIPKNYYSNLSCYEDFVIRTNLLGYDVSDDELYDCIIGEDNIHEVYGNFYFFAVDNGTSRHLCIIDRKGNHIENAVIEGDFDCSSMDLTSLKGGPSEVGGKFYCYTNNLISLEGGPREVGGDFCCSYNNLTSLVGGPGKVGGSFYCPVNNLTSLEGSPIKVGGGFYCLDNDLTSLEGSPIEVGGDFNCFKNNLTSLEGAPIKVGGAFDCSKNNLTSNQVQAYKKWLKTNPSGSYNDAFCSIGF